MIGPRVTPLRYGCAVLLSLILSSCAPSLATASVTRSDDSTRFVDTMGVSVMGSLSTDQVAAPLFESALMQPIDRSLAFRDTAGGDRPQASDIGGVTAVAMGDFDEDGVQDVVAQLTIAGRPAIGLYRGNGGAIYPHHPIYRAAGDAPFAPVVDLVEQSVSFEFLVSGDFDADGHLDIAGAAESENQLRVVFGNGIGGFGRSSSIALSGRVRGLASGEFGRADGLADLGVSVEGEDGPSIVILTGPEGAAPAAPIVVGLDSPASALSFGHADSDTSSDLVIGAEEQLIVLRSEQERVSSKVYAVDDRVQSIAVGTFGRNERVAALTDRGAVLLFDVSNVRSTGHGKAPRTSRVVATVVTGGSGHLVPTGFSTDGTEGLVVVDTESSRLTSVRNNGARDVGSWVGGAGTSAAIAMRLGPDAESGIVAFTRHNPVPVALAPKVTSTILVTTTGDAGAGTLREAILQANSTPGTDRIEFDIPGPGPHVISPLTPLSFLSDVTTVDGQTEPDFNGSPIVVIDGTQIVGTPGLIEVGIGVLASGCVIRGLRVVNCAGPAIDVREGAGTIVEANWVGLDAAGTAAAPNISGVNMSGGPGHLLGGTSVAARNVISGSMQSGAGGSARDSRIEGNYVGLNATGTGPVPNGTGISVSGPNSVVGGTAAGSRNVASGNVSTGIRINPQGSGSLVQGNIVGLDESGISPLANGGIGIDSQAGNGTTIGGTSAAARNIVAGNGLHGVRISTGAPSEVFVQGNVIGLATDGATPVGNGGDGILVDNPWESTYVGGATSGARNVVSSNGGAGIKVNGSNDVFIEGNYVGTDVSGNLPRGNTGFGIVTGNSGRVGGTAAGSGNVVAANSAGGIQLPGRYVLVLGNRIGVSATGTPLGNLGDGISLGLSAGGGDFANNRIGGSAAGEGNDIRFNGGNGVSVVSQLGQRVIGNRIADNGGIGIDLNADGPTANDAGDTDFGANALQNAPVPTLATASGASTQISASLTSVGQRTYRIDFYSNATCKPEGDRYLGGVDTTTDANGSATVSFTFGEPLAGMWITSTATEVQNGTSEFSTCVQVTTSTPTGADLGITGSATPNPVESGATCMYSITVSNAGPESATATTAIADTPVGTTFVSAAVSQGNVTGPAVGTRGLVTFTLGDLPSGATVTATVVVSVTAAPGATIGFASSATSQRADPSTINNTTASTVAVAEQGTTPIADVSLDVSGPSDPVVAGSMALYALTVANEGPSVATDVIVATAVPAGTTLHSIASTRGTLSAPPTGSTGPVQCSVSSLNVGETVTVTLTLLVAAEPGTTIVLAGMATSAVQDNSSANNSDSASAIVIGDVTPPEVARIVPATGAPFRLKILGSRFQSGILVYISDDVAPWSTVAFKGDGKLLIKEGGRLKRMFPRGVAVPIRLVNPDGGVATASFTR